MSSQELRLTSKQISNTSPFQHRTLLNLFELLKFHPHEESLTLKKIILACQQALVHVRVAHKGGRITLEGFLAGKVR